MPSIVSFDKYSSVKTKEYHIVIKDICCEFCFRGIIEDLFEIDGIEKVASTFHEYNEKENVIIKIDYNPAMIKEKELKALELKWNA